ncbi:MAG TPA: hypothetical protein VMY76_08795 [Gemmatimonadales bacterium]|nr:hypothetical protein [Gemmatimonadales bacterium]
MGLRSAFTANLPLKVTSLALSVFLWFLAAGEEPASALLPVELSVRAPPGRTVVHTGGPVRALVSGPRRELLKLSASPMRLIRVVPDTTATDQVDLDLGPGDLELPRGVDVHVQDVQPRRVGVNLDSTFQRVVPVRAVVQLQPGTGQAMSAIEVVPGTVRLLGRRDEIRRIATVQVRVRGATPRLARIVGDSVPVLVDWGGAPGPGRAGLRVLAPAGLDAVSVPDTVVLVRRRADG